MTSKDLTPYADAHWNDYRTTVTEASRSEQGKVLVKHSFPLYNFDQISKDLFPEDHTPTSADGLYISDGNIHLVEFKSGFKQKVTKNSLEKKKEKDPKYGRCPKIMDIDDPCWECFLKGICLDKQDEKIQKLLSSLYYDDCSEYWKLFWENQNRKIEELKSSIRLKAIESYLTMEKHILPLCPDNAENKTVKMIFTVVVDENGADGLEDIMAAAAGCETPDSNRIEELNTALKRLADRKDADENPYLYDEIKVVTAAEFSQKLKQNRNP